MAYAEAHPTARYGAAATPSGAPAPAQASQSAAVSGNDDELSIQLEGPAAAEDGRCRVGMSSRDFAIMRNGPGRM